MSMAGTASFWLRHADRAVTSPVRATITGQLPAWLRGNLYRNGAAVKEIGPDKYSHLFDGLACVHKFHIDGAGGQVTYQNRFLESDDYRANMASGRIEASAFGTLGREDLCRSLYGRLMSTFRDLRGAGRRSDNCSVSVGYYGPELYAMTETDRIWRLNEDDLGADKQVDLRKVVAVSSATAHPHVAPDGTVYNIGHSLPSRGNPPSVNVVEFPAPGSPEVGSGRVLGKIPNRWPLEPSYFHSFGITPNYFVFVQQPVLIQVKKLLMLKLKKRPILEAIVTKPELGTWIRLVDRRNGQLHPTIFTCDTFYVFHHVNAYEEDGHLVTDLCCQLPGELDCMDFGSVEYLSRSEKEGPDQPMFRFVLPLDPKTESGSDTNQVRLSEGTAAAYRRSDGTVHCVPRKLSPPEYRALDLPRINYTYNGHKYRYVYGCRFAGTASNSERLVKVDVQKGTSICWVDPEWSPSEPVFVPLPDADDAAEDAGVLLASLLHVTDRRRTALLVLDAATMTELARADVTTEVDLAKDFHGVFAAHGSSIHGL